MPTYRLITIGPSHYCEKARWALERYRIPFREEVHAPVLHAFASYRNGGKRSLPVLVTDTGVYNDSTDILELVDRHASGALFGSGAERRETSELEDRFDEELGPHTRRVIYAHMLDDKPFMMGTFAKNVPKVERSVFNLAFPGAKRMMRKAMSITPEGAERSVEKIEELMNDMSERLADGRKFLTGDRFTVADLTFAALAAPLVLPAEYGWPLPSPDDLPEPLRDLVTRLRATRAGVFVLRVYRDERRRKLAAGAN